MNSSPLSFNHSALVSSYFVFQLTWWLGFLIYPLWYLPASDGVRTIACGGLFMVFGLCSYLFHTLTTWKMEWGYSPDEPCASTFFWGILFPIAFAVHLPFLPWPILAGLDTIDHAAIPAVVAHQIVKSLSSVFGFSLQPLLAAVGILIIVVLCLSPKLRNHLVEGFVKIAVWSHSHFWLTLVVLAGMTWVYAVAIFHFQPLDRFGDVDPLFRYPPLSKMFSIPLYVGFGLQEWVGRVMQIGFTFGTAVYLYRLARLYGGATAGEIAAILFVFLPPVFHYGNTTMIEGGTWFFVTATFFYWIRFVEYKAQFDLVAGTLFATLACLYKHTGVSVIPAFAFMVAYDFLFSRTSRSFRSLWPSILACAIPSITIVLFMKLSGFNSDVPSDLQFPGWKSFVGNLYAMPQGITLPITLIFLAGWISFPWIRNGRTFVIFTGWIGAHYFLTCMSAAALNVRQALPYYLGLIVPAALFVETILGNRTWIRRCFVYGILPGFLLWACLWMDRNQDYRKIGRAMGDRSYINFSNWNSMYLPYPQTVQALKKITQPGDVIYAPMINEPVQFYLAKYDLGDRRYHRELWAKSGQQTLESLLDYCKRIQAKWLVVVRGRWLYDSYADLRWIEQLFEDPPSSFVPVQVVPLGTEQIGIWKIEFSNS